MDNLHEIQKFISKQNKLSTLRFITCGSVDDGKSTLLGRLLYESKLLFDDQVETLMNDSKRLGTNENEIDFSLLVDGLSAEREQGITIDVAYRFFSTDKRKFIVADSPGHEQYTRNMVTAASNAELAIILIDARNGILPQTRRHSFIANMVGIKHVIVAINKMDLVGYNEDIFYKIVSEYQDEVLSKLDFASIDFLPVSALKGDNIVSRSTNMPWFTKNPLVNLLEKVEIKPDEKTNFSMPVQIVNRPDQNFRGFCGTISSGKLRLGDKIYVSSSNLHAKVSKILIGDREVDDCIEGDAVTLTIDKEIDISRGDLLCSNKSDISKSNLFLTNLIWFDGEECFQNRRYLFKSANKTSSCEIIKIKHKINVNNFENHSASALSMNDISVCEIMLDEERYLQPYAKNRITGNFILIDKKSNLTVAAGTVKHDIRRSSNIKWQNTDVDKKKRENLLNQKSFVIWFTGLSGSGKSSIANMLEKTMNDRGLLTYILDGDNLRHGLNKDLGFKKEDRIENLRRVGEVAKILYDSGVIVLASFISPFKSDRKNIKDLFPSKNFIEVYVKTSLEILKKRDPKGLYKKALAGELPNFTGISAPYEEPKKPDLVINTENTTIEKSVDEILKYLEENNCI